MGAVTPYHSLPPELLDKFFEELKFRALIKSSSQKEYVGSIRSCLFVSRPFRHRALHVLFQHVHVTDGPIETGNERVFLLRQIVSPPSTLQLEGVRSHIETFSISLKSHKMSIFSSPSEYLNRLKRFLGDENLLSVIRCLHGNGYGIKELKIALSMTRSGRGSCGLKWEELDLRFRLALQDLIQSPRLNYLWISDVHHLPLTFLDKSHVKYLLHHQSILGQHMSLFSHSAQDLPYPILEVHFFSRSDSHNDDKPSNVPFQNLKSYVALSNGPEQLKVTWDIIHSGAQSLEVVSIQNYGTIVMPPAAFSLDHVLNLSWFSYSQRHIPFFRPDNAEQSLGRLYQFLDVKSPMKRLQHLELDLQCHVAGFPGESLHSEILAIWRMFDELFSGPKYPLLRDIQLKIFVEIVGESDDDFDDFDSDAFIESTTLQIRQCFLRLSTMDGVVFKTVVDTSVEIVE